MVRHSLFLILFLVIGLAGFTACNSDNSTAIDETKSAKIPANKAYPTSYAGMVSIPGGTLHMGGDNAQADPNEFPKHQVTIDSFWMDQFEVSNREFAAFVAATDYQTVAERPIDWAEMAKDLPPGTPRPPDSLLQPGALVFDSPTNEVAMNNPGNWWNWVIGANWRHPEGPASNIIDRMDHPVVQIAWEDAEAYAAWAGKRLPTEAEWEWAARGGQQDLVYPWGNDLQTESGAWQANFWQGPFPYVNELLDEYATTAPVSSFAPNGYGLYNMAGNVWEWCNDWFDISYYSKPAASQVNTQGPEQAYNPMTGFVPEKVVRGGSFLCAENYCSGYRNARRMGSSPDTGLNHTGFRCVAD